MKIPPQFTHAVEQLFARWDILRDAVSSNLGGVHSREKSEWLPSVVVEFFAKNVDLDASEVESFIAEIMDIEFDLIVEDGSLDRLAKQLSRAFALARDHRFEELNDFLSKLPAVKSTPATKIRADDESSSDDDEDDDGSDGKEKNDDDESIDRSEPMEIEDATSSTNRNRSTPRAKDEPIVDEDGFTLVVGKKKH